MNAQANRPLEGLYILIVEDSSVTALNTVRILQERGGATVEITSTLATAKERLEAARFDMIILDHGLGAAQRGTDLALWMMYHTNERIRQILRISYSGAEPATIFQDVPIEAINTIFAAMHTKPIPLKELIILLRDTAERHGKIQQTATML